MRSLSYLTKSNLLLATLTSLLLLASCGESTTSSESGSVVKVEVTPGKSVLVPSPGRDCKESLDPGATTRSLGEPYVAFNSFSITYTGTQTNLIILNIELIFTGNSLSSGKYVSNFEIVTDESQVVLKSGEKVSPLCGLRAGGVTMKNPKSQAFLTGTVKVTAIETGTDGSETVVYGYTTVEVQYPGKQ